MAPTDDESAPGHSHDDGSQDHGHVHQHDAVHEHPHTSTETIPEPSGPGTVVVEIGGNIGAAVVNTPSDLDGEEIEIRTEPGEWTGRHVAVRPRPLRDRTIHAAFFESLTEGSYMLRVRFGPPGAVELPLEVSGAKVSVVDWPGTPGS